MKRKLFAFVYCAIIFGAFALTGCNNNGGFFYGKTVGGEGEVISREFDAADANNLIVKDIQIRQGNSSYQADVVIKGGEEKKVVVTAQESLFDEIDVVCSNGNLTVKGGANEYYATNSIKVEVCGYTFDKVELSCCRGTLEGATLTESAQLWLSGSCDMTLDNAEKDSLEINLSGASELKAGSLNVGKLVSDVSGAGELDANVVVAQGGTMRVSGAGEFDFESAKIDELELNLSGASKGEISAMETGKLKAAVSGASELEIDGKCTYVKVVLSGSSEFDGKNCVISEADLTLSGGSDAEITCAKMIVSASGASTVRYYGVCEVTKKDVDISSKVVQG